MLRSTLTRALAVLVATSALLASPAHAGMYPSDGPVINLDAKGFKKVMASEVGKFTFGSILSTPRADDLRSLAR